MKPLQDSEGRADSGDVRTCRIFSRFLITNEAQNHFFAVNTSIFTPKNEFPILQKAIGVISESSGVFTATVRFRILEC